MALHVAVSNDLSSLSSQLGNDLLQRNTAVFSPYRIVNQTQGISNWLKQQMAAQLGIFANATFLQPNDLFTHIYHLLGGQRSNAVDPENSRWSIFAHLEEASFIQQFPDLATYYKGDERKRMALAEKTADLLDQYQVYRPAMIKNWNQGKTHTNDPVTKMPYTEELWQMELWRKIKSTYEVDKTTQFDYIILQLKDPQAKDKLKAQLPALYFFGISILTPFHIDLFQVLSEIIDLHFYLLNPAPAQYWLDDLSAQQIDKLKFKHRQNALSATVGNTLLLNLGKIVKDTFKNFFKYDSFLNAYNEVNCVEPQTETLLGKIQSDIYFNIPPFEQETLHPKMINDGSIVVNSCHTPVREVEVLYNYLVKQVDAGNLTSPRECVVMVTDIDVYAPYIQAIFNNAPYLFPYTIADNTIAIGDSIYSALTALFNFDHHFFRAEDVIQLLDAKAVAQKFGITNSLLLRDALKAANVRFGIAGSEEDETYLLGFDHGMKRMLHSICTRTNEEDEIDVAEGQAALELVRLMHFVEVLKTLTKQREGKKTLAQWLSYTDELIDQLISEQGANQEEELLLLTKRMEMLNVLTDNYADSFSFEVFRQVLLPYLNAEKRNNAFVAGGITFCSLIPMRSVPFRTVCLLGLNFDKFPRKENPMGFDLMAKQPVAGDRNVKDNDKHLFLETLLSARQNLYLSYQGHNSKDNATLPPSAVIDELLDYIGNADFKVTHHPLHGFSPKYNDTNGEGNKALYTYIGYGDETGRHDQLNPRKVIPNNQSFIENFISPKQLIDFFDNPYKCYFNQVLGIYYRDNDEVLEDTEMFEPNHLDKWKINHQLLDITDENALEALRNKLVRKSELPLKHSGTLDLLQLNDDLHEIKALWQKACNNQPPSTYKIDALNVQGEIQGLYGNRLVYISLSSKDFKYQLRAYLNYLMAVSSGFNGECVFVSKAKKKMHILKPLASDQLENKKIAMQILAELIVQYSNGQTTLWHFANELQFTDEAVDGTTDNILAYQKNVINKLNSSSPFNAINDEYLLKAHELDVFEDIEVIKALSTHNQYMAELIEQAFSKG